VPEEQVLKNAQFRPEMVGVDVPGSVYSHLAGIDIVRAANLDGSGTYYVLEGNLRVPSGVSYCAREPQDDDAPVSRAVLAAPRGAPVAATRTSCWNRCARWHPRASTSRVSWC
jgi:hypothetical protein